MKKLSLTFLLIGVSLVLAGFIYGVLFAGIPFQDPSPEMRARYGHDADFAIKIGFLGVVALLVGFAGLIFFRKPSKKGPIQATTANDRHTD